MELRGRIDQIRISGKEEVTIPPFHPDDVTLLFADIDKLLGLILNHNDPT